MLKEKLSLFAETYAHWVVQCIARMHVLLTARCGSRWILFAPLREWILSQKRAVGHLTRSGDNKKIIDFCRISSISFDFLRNSLIFLAFPLFPFVFLWFSAIFCNFHWFPLIFPRKLSILRAPKWLPCWIKKLTLKKSRGSRSVQKK